MKLRSYLMLILFFAINHLIIAQSIHPNPYIEFDNSGNPVDHYSTSLSEGITDTEVIGRIEHIIRYLDGALTDTDLAEDVNLPEGQDTTFETHFRGINAVYFSKRILTHIQLYRYYFLNGNTSKVNQQKEYIEDFFVKLLDEQCVAGSSQTHCDPNNPVHGGFPADFNGIYQSTIVNPLVTSLGLRAYIEVKDYYESIGMNESPIDCEEFNVRIQKAKHALYTYSQFNYMYINMTAHAQMAAAGVYDLYNDQSSHHFLVQKTSELFTNSGYLRPIGDNDNTWNRNWKEGIQLDGSWRDYGAVEGIIDESAENQKWHDSEVGYHSIIIEGLANLYGVLKEGNFKEEVKEKLINSINHIIDYNGHTSIIDNAVPNFNPYVTDVNGSPLYMQTRLTPNGRVTRYHREIGIDDYYSDKYTGCDFSTIAPDDVNDYYCYYNRKVIGVSFLRCLLISRNTLKNEVSEEELNTLDGLIFGITREILETLYRSLSFEQLFDLSLFLNRDNLREVDNHYFTKDELVVGFENEEIKSFKENSNGKISHSQDIFNYNEKVLLVNQGDFNGDGNGELVGSFDNGRVTKFHKIGGSFVHEGSIYLNPDIKAINMVSGDFDGDGIDELILALENGNIKRFRENEDGILVEQETFYVGSIKSTLIESGDFDGDDIDELIVVFESGHIFRFKENSSNQLTFFENFYTYNSSQPVAKKIISGNFNHDNKDELIIAFDNGDVARYKEDFGATNLTNNQMIYQGNNLAECLEKGDFNLDGKDELIIAYNNSNISRYSENSNNSVITLTQDIYNGQLCRDLISGDFNGDSKDELIIAFEGGILHRYFENGSGLIAPESPRFYLGNVLSTAVSVKTDKIPCSSNNLSSNLPSDSYPSPDHQENSFNDLTLKNQIDAIVIELEKQKNTNYTLEIYDALGRVHYKENFDEKTSINKINLIDGLNFISISHEGERKTIKFLYY